MPNEELSNYIKEAKESGMTDEAIRRELLNSGWREEDIDLYFSALVGSDKRPVDLLSATKLLEKAWGRFKDKYKPVFQIILFALVLAVLSLFVAALDEFSVWALMSVVINLLFAVASVITAILLIYLFGKDDTLKWTEYLKLAPFAQIDKRFANIQRMSINPPFLSLMTVICKKLAVNSL